MKSGIPWSVKGIEPEVREAAKDAARRSGLTLGEWLNTTILEQTEARANQKSRDMHPLVRDRFSRIAEELAMMTAERPQEKPARPFQLPSQGDTTSRIRHRAGRESRTLSDGSADLGQREAQGHQRTDRQAGRAGGRQHRSGGKLCFARSGGEEHRWPSRRLAEANTGDDHDAAGSGEAPR